MRLGFSKDKGSGKKHMAYRKGGEYKESKSQKKERKKLEKSQKKYLSGRKYNRG